MSEDKYICPILRGGSLPGTNPGVRLATLSRFASNGDCCVKKYSLGFSLTGVLSVCRYEYGNARIPDHCEGVLNYTLAHIRRTV